MTHIAIAVRITMGISLRDALFLCLKLLEANKYKQGDSNETIQNVDRREMGGC